MGAETGPRFREAIVGEEGRLVALERAASLRALAHIFPPELYPYPTEGVRDRWHRLLRDSSVRIGIAEDESGLTALVAFDDEVLRHLAVRPDQWGAGLARAAIAWAIDRGDVRRLWCLEENERALGLYDHLGWNRTGRRQRAEFPPYPVEVELVRS